MQHLRYTTFLFIGLLILCTMLMVNLVWSFITPIFLALILVSIFSPVYNKLFALFGRRSYLAASFATIFVLLCVLIPAVLLIATLSSQALYLYETAANSNIIGRIALYISESSSLHDLINKVAPKLGINNAVENFVQFAEKFTQYVGLWIYNNLSGIASNVVSIIFGFILTLIIVFTLFVTGAGLKNFLMNMVPLPHSEKERLIIRFRDMAKAVFVGNGIVSIVEGVLGGFGMSIFGVGPGIFWGVIMWFVAFLPIGVSVIFFPATIILFVNGRPAIAVAYFVYNAVYAVVLEAFVKPRLIGGKNRLHAVLVFLAVLGGMEVYGVLGIFYGPLILTMFLTLAEIFQDHYRSDLFGE